MMVIGLTGSIASGKSTLAAMLKNANIPVIDADDLSREVTQKGQPTLRQIVEAFGEDILQKDGSLDRQRLGKIVFRDKEALLKLESLTHPAIKSLFMSKLAHLQAQNQEVLVYVAPLLFEKNLQSQFAQTILIIAKDEIMLERIRKRDGMSEEEARLRIETQMSTKEKMKLADHIIENNGNLDDLHKKLGCTWKNITNKSLTP